MTPETHRRVRALFDEAREWPEPERVARLQSACSGEPEVFEAVTRLLQAHRSCDSFLQEPARPMQRIGRYVITGELGRGAMGVVYDALDPVIGRKLAVKVIRLQALTDAAEARFLRERLFREARSAGVLSHPGIVTVFDVGEEGDLAFIAMERVEGVSLDRVLASGRRFSRAEAIHIIRQVAAALDYAHWNGVVHRDVKPANIMIDNWLNAKIADFGIAKTASSHSQTLSGMMIGTPLYMSPEQLEAFPVDGSSDQFSLCVVAYELLTGRRPFQADTLATLAHLIVYSERPSARAANPGLPPAVDPVLRRGLARSSKQRYASCNEFAAALNEALRDSGVQPQLPTPLQPAPRFDAGDAEGRTSKLRIAGAGAAAALQAAVLLFALRSPQQPAQVKQGPALAALPEVSHSKSMLAATRDKKKALELADPPKSRKAIPDAGGCPAIPLTMNPGNEGVSRPILTRYVRPEYSAIARKLGVDGSVGLRWVVKADGRTCNVTVVSSLGYGLDENAVQAARKWLFSPGKKNGTPIPAVAGSYEGFHPDVKAARDWVTGPIAFKPVAGIAEPVILDGERPRALTLLLDESVLLGFIVDSNGDVKDVHRINGSESSGAPLAECLTTWKFQPARKGAEAVNAIGRVRFIKGRGDEAAHKPLFEVPTRLTPH